MDALLCFQREKDRKIYTDDWNLAEEELEGHRLFDIDEKMVSDNFPQCFVKEMKGEGEYSIGTDAFEMFKRFPHNVPFYTAPHCRCLPPSRRRF